MQCCPRHSSASIQYIIHSTLVYLTDPLPYSDDSEITAFGVLLVALTIVTVTILKSS
jgi:hypothetical protein